MVIVGKKGIAEIGDSPRRHKIAIRIVDLDDHDKVLFENLSVPNHGAALSYAKRIAGI